MHCSALSSQHTLLLTFFSCSCQAKAAFNASQAELSGAQADAEHAWQAGSSASVTGLDTTTLNATLLGNECISAALKQIKTAQIELRACARQVKLKDSELEDAQKYICTARIRIESLEARVAATRYDDMELHKLREITKSAQVETDRLQREMIALQTEKAQMLIKLTQQRFQNTGQMQQMDSNQSPRHHYKFETSTVTQTASFYKSEPPPPGPNMSQMSTHTTVSQAPSTEQHSHSLHSTPGRAPLDSHSYRYIRKSPCCPVFFVIVSCLPTLSECVPPPACLTSSPSVMHVLGSAIE